MSFPAGMRATALVVFVFASVHSTQTAAQEISCSALSERIACNDPELHDLREAAANWRTEAQQTPRDFRHFATRREQCVEDVSCVRSELQTEISELQRQFEANKASPEQLTPEPQAIVAPNPADLAELPRPQSSTPPDRFELSGRLQTSETNIAIWRTILAAIGLAGVLFGVAVVLPRWRLFDLRERGSRMRIPHDRALGALLLAATVGLPAWGIAVAFTAEADDLFLLAPGALGWVLALNAFVSCADYVLIDYTRKCAKFRPHGLLAVLPITQQVALDEIEAHRSGTQTTISSSRDRGVTSSISHTLTITGAFGARELRFASPALRDIAVRALFRPRHP